MDKSSQNSNSAIEITCPHCNTPEWWSLDAVARALVDNKKLRHVACGKTFEIKIYVPDRAAELPLEPTAPTTAADNYRSDEDIPGVVDDISELWS